MDYGVCTAASAAAPYAAAGFDFIETTVGTALKPRENEDAFHEERRRMEAAPLPCKAANCFLPGDLKVTGPDVDPGALRAYVTVVCRRAALCGIETIVFGSGGARQVPDGFDRDRAWAQLVAFGQMLGPIAEAQGVMIAVEPLNSRDCNILTTVGEAARYVGDVGHPRVRLLVDGYHWSMDNDSADDVTAAAPLLRHIHIATYAHRLAPGAEPCDFSAFFAALRRGGYDGRVSIEGKWEDPAAQAGKALAELKRLTEGV